MDCSDKYTSEDSATRKMKICKLKPHFKNLEIQELSELSIEDEWKNCKKPQGHGGFLPWQKFLEDPKSHLCKAGINDDVTTADYIKTSGALVVRLVVGYVSGDRPEELYNALLNKLNAARSVTASGLIIHVEQSIEKCRCYKCRSVDKRLKTWNIYISTATHAVYDNTEAFHTRAELFFESEDRGSVARVFVNTIEERSIIGDACVLKCVTCDEKLYQDLSGLLTKQKQLYAALPLCERPTAVIISHPHGMYKHISWGPCTIFNSARKQQFNINSYCYKTTTCKGCSGAPVLVLHTKCQERHTYVISSTFPQHSGANSDGNYCAIYQEPTLQFETEEITHSYFDVNTKHSSIIRRFEHKPSLFMYDCTKNPGHLKFIPIYDFSLRDLPYLFTNNDILVFIRTLALLSGKLDVGYVSPKRPENVTCFRGQYPMYDKRGCHFAHNGTCTVLSVKKLEDSVCFCKQCKDSGTPSHSHYMYYINVAAHSVFDDCEASQTRVLLKYDNDKSVVLYLDGCRIIDSDANADWSIMECISCDKNVYDEVSTALKRLYSLEKIINMKYGCIPFEKRLVLIVSHPHGCPKHISVGKIKYKHLEEKSYDNLNCRFVYTACTCPGSSGAAVYVLGQSYQMVVRRFITPHVHSDNQGNGWNSSGYAVE